MKARINKDLTFNKDFIEQAIASRRSMSELATQLKTAPAYIEMRITALFGVDGGAKIDELYANGKENKRKTVSEKSKKPSSKKSLSSLESGELEKISRDVATPVYNCVKLEVSVESDEPSESDSHSSESFFDVLAKNLGGALEYALRQSAADSDAGEKYEEADTSASRSALKKLDIEINAAEKAVTESRQKLSAAQIEKTQAEERVERATEKLRRAKLDVSHANSALDSAESTLSRDKEKLEQLKKQRYEMEQAIENIELPTFEIVPSTGNCIVLKAINYDVRKMETLDAALKWGRLIGEKFSDLSDSEFATMGRLFGILSKLHGKYKLSIDPSLSKAIEVYGAFKDCFT